jgi:tetratricopeptide (TPR) repeat protein
VKALLFPLLPLVIAACAGEPPPTLDDISSDVRVETLPSKAHVAIDGKDLGPAPASLHVQAGHAYRIAVTAVGFEPRNFGGSGDDLLKNRTVEIVLAPQGFEGAPPNSDDSAGLSAAAGALERRKDWGHAAEYWHRVITLSPRGARGHKGLGSCLAKLGKDELAIREYEQYIFLDPDAEDAERVRKAIDAYRGGIEIKPQQEEP